MKEHIYKIRLTFAIIALLIFISGTIGLIHHSIVNHISLTALLKHILIDYSGLWLGITVGLFLITLIFGRVFCSLLCPLGIFQDIICIFSEEYTEKRKNYPFKYIILAVTVIASVLLFIFLPNIHLSKPLLIILVALCVLSVIAIGILAFFKKRIFCTDICPFGAFFGLVSKISIFKMYIDKSECLNCGICERNCVSACIDSNESEIENVTCVKCFKCMPECTKGALHYGIKH